MAVLKNLTTNQTLVPQLSVARTFWSRGKGLLGRSALPQEEALWIHRCNSIHTYFMKFSIDCVFVDKNLQVKAIYQDVKPWRLVAPVWGASSVIELAAGTVTTMKINVGDQLYVGA
ncbi:DUF192 domain-containing protein [Bdellovibrio reynosensis]|uniref:DUF192 domain-containing protein n=1 Tax=Bdellovibrio reynosensis TaxID=2835041 RepID=A0ABY4C8H5_9BACT|nr:DUF192 domain-containing protein [Bdellovibrio reynosensis]UOE99985.1 DUF192 domain-containing protein [Bdellovibrio reynosensis]